MSLCLRWQPGHWCLGPPQALQGALEQAVSTSVGAQPACWSRGAWDTCQHFPLSSWDKKAAPGGQAFPSHPHLQDIWSGFCQESPQHAAQLKLGAWGHHGGTTIFEKRFLQRLLERLSSQFWRSTFFTFLTLRAFCSSQSGTREACY